MSSSEVGGCGSGWYAGVYVGGCAAAWVAAICVMGIATEWNVCRGASGIAFLGSVDGSSSKRPTMGFGGGLLLLTPPTPPTSVDAAGYPGAGCAAGNVLPNDGAGGSGIVSSAGAPCAGATP